MNDWRYFFHHVPGNLDNGTYRIFEPEWKLPKIVITFKPYLGEQVYQCSSYRYEAVFNLIWHCAENMNYPAFYKAWHN